jgi:hypothetical protein
MSNQPDRPATLPRRNRPQPAPDEGTDPVIPAAAASHQTLVQPESDLSAPVRTAPVRRRQATVQLGVRVPEDVADMVAEEAARRGISQREVVEEAIRAQLG